MITVNAISDHEFIARTDDALHGTGPIVMQHIDALDVECILREGVLTGVPGVSRQRDVLQSINTWETHLAVCREFVMRVQNGERADDVACELA